MPEKYMDTPPHGLLITQVNGYPDGLLAIPDKNVRIWDHIQYKTTLY
jgi:hypothetical protein